MKREAGQALIESLIALVGMLGFAFASFELARLMCLRTLTHTLAEHFANSIALRPILIKQLQGTLGKEKLEVKLDALATTATERFMSGSGPWTGKNSYTVLVSLDRDGIPPGVFVTIKSCYEDQLKTKTIKNPTGRNCQGQYSLLSPAQWAFGTSAYAPWPATLQIYNIGVHDSFNLVGQTPFPEGGNVVSRLISQGEKIGFEPLKRLLSSVGAHDFAELEKNNSRTRVDTSLNSGSFRPWELSHE